MADIAVHAEANTFVVNLRLAETPSDEASIEQQKIPSSHRAAAAIIASMIEHKISIELGLFALHSTRWRFVRGGIWWKSNAEQQQRADFSNISGCKSKSKANSGMSKVFFIGEFMCLG